MELTTNVAAFAELPSLLKRVVASEKQRVIVVNALSRAQEAPPSKLLSQLFSKSKAVVAKAIQILHLSVNRDCPREKMWPK